MNYFNMNTAEDPKNNDDIIQRGTLVKIRMDIKKGFHRDEEKGWVDDYPTLSSAGTGAVYLDCASTILHGAYKGRKIWHKIGLHSEKGGMWMQMGRAFIKGALSSARGYTSDDKSSQAEEARIISSFADIDGLIFIARIGVEKDARSEKEKNTISSPITAENASYEFLMNEALEYVGQESGVSASSYRAAQQGESVADDDFPF